MIKTTLSDAAVRKLTSHQRNLLIDHIDGPVDVVVTDAHKVQCRNALIGLGLLRGTPSQAVRPRLTVLTERGRMAVAMVLGDYADALVRAGLLEQENPLLVLKRLKAARQPAPAVTMANAARALAKLA
jgi:hypothetical protein